MINLNNEPYGTVSDWFYHLASIFLIPLGWILLGIFWIIDKVRGENDSL